MLENIWNLMNNVFFLKCIVWAGIPLTIILLILFLLKSHRDERGWKIIGKASIITLIFFIVLMNVVAKVAGRLVFYDYNLDFLFFANTIQFVYDAILFVEIISILILRKIE